MKINVTFQVDTPAEAREILKAVENLTKAPYRLEGFGVPVVKDAPPVQVQVPADTDLNLSATPEDFHKVVQGAMVHAYATPPAPEGDWTIEPPGEMVSKIGFQNQELIMAALKDGPRSLQLINTALKRSVGQLPSTASSLALLWRRHFLQYDGAEYRINPKIGDL